MAAAPPSSDVLITLVRTGIARPLRHTALPPGAFGTRVIVVEAFWVSKASEPHVSTSKIGCQELPWTRTAISSDGGEAQDLVMMRCDNQHFRL